MENLKTLSISDLYCIIEFSNKEYNDFEKICELNSKDKDCSKKDLKDCETIKNKWNYLNEAATSELYKRLLNLI